jgi:hypothetical protein
VADLDPIIQELILNASEFVADMDEVIHLMQDARDNSVSLDAAIGVLEEALSSATRELADLTEGFIAAGAGEDDLSDRAVTLEAVIDTLRDAISNLRDGNYEVAASADVAGDAMEVEAAKAAILTAAIAKEKSVILQAAADQIFASAALDAYRNNIGNLQNIFNGTDQAIDETSVSVRSATGWWARWGTVIHWVIAGGFEFLAVFIPAMYALAAAVTVASDALGFIYVRFKAMYDVQQSTNAIFGDTINSILGLKSVMQQAQNVADPKVYELLGAAINIVSHNSKQFLDVGLSTMNMLDDFAAKLSGEMDDRMSTLNSLLAKGARDLQLFGAVLGNVGHAILNLANAAPGLADVLLLILAGLTYLIRAFSDLPAKIITTAFVLEEFARWGGLVNTILGKMTGQAVIANRGFSSFFFNVGNTAKNMVNIVSGAFLDVTTALGNLSLKAGATMTTIALEGEEMDAVAMEALSLGVSLDVAGGSMLAFAAEARAAIAALTPLQAFLIVLAAAGFAFLIYKIVSATDATEQWAEATNNALAHTSDLNLIPKIADDIATAYNKMASATQQASTAQKNLNNDLNTRFGNVGLVNAVGAANAQVNQLKQELTYLDQAQENLMVNAGNISRTYGTTFVGALELAQQAGVNLTDSINWQSKAADIDRLKIANYITGMQAMGQTAGAVGRDVTLIGIDSELSADKIQQLNQAVDSFVSGLTGGTAGMGALQQSILNIGQAAGTTTGTLSDAREGMNLSLSQIKNALTNFGSTGSQVWQNFDNALSGSGEQLADWFRTAGTEGAISSQNFQQAMLDIVSEFIPFAQKSKIAQSELVGFAQAQGLNINSFKGLVSATKEAGAGAKSLADIVGLTTKQMADMNEVAQNLGATVGPDLVASLNSARIAASQLGQSAEDLATAWFKVHTINGTVIGDFKNVFNSLYEVYHNTGMAKSAADAYAHSLGMTSKQVSELNKLIEGYIRTLDGIPKSISTTLSVQEQYAGYLAQAGTSAVGGGHPLPAPGSPGTTSAKSAASVTVHVHGSVATSQSIVRAVQAGINQKTTRNGSTQLFLAGRKH